MIISHILIISTSSFFVGYFCVSCAVFFVLFCCCFLFVCFVSSVYTMRRT